MEAFIYSPLARGMLSSPIVNGVMCYAPHAAASRTKPPRGLFVEQEQGRVEKLNKIYLLTKKGEILASIIAHFLSGHLALYMGDSWLAFQSPFARTARNPPDWMDQNCPTGCAYVYPRIAWLWGHRQSDSQPASQPAVFTSKQAKRKIHSE